MITLVIAVCASIAMNDCGPEKRVPLPTRTTVVECEQIRQVMLMPEVGPLIIPDEFKQIFCEVSR